MAKKHENLNDQKIEEVIALLSEFNLSEIDIKKGKVRIRAKKEINGDKKNSTYGKSIQYNNIQYNKNREENKEEKKKFKEIKSPLGGTIYCAPFPGANPFVEEGSFVKKGQTVAVVEAMKLFNEIKSEFEGKVVEILIKEGQSVKINQPLFLIE